MGEGRYERESALDAWPGVCVRWEGEEKGAVRRGARRGRGGTGAGFWAEAGGTGAGMRRESSSGRRDSREQLRPTVCSRFIDPAQMQVSQQAVTVTRHTLLNPAQQRRGRGGARREGAGTQRTSALTTAAAARGQTRADSLWTRVEACMGLCASAGNWLWSG
jgi:hypothetical protein